MSELQTPVLVEIRPIDVKKWHGKSGSESFARPKVFEVLFDSTKGRYATGLTEEEEIKYSKALGVPLDSTFSAEEAHPTWSSKAFFITLNNSTMILDISRPMDFVKYKNMKASKYVANSIKELEEGLWPDATHVIYSEEEDMDARATKEQKKAEAYILASKLSMQDKANVILLANDVSCRGRSDNFIAVEIGKVIDTKPERLIQIVSMGKEELYARSTILEAIQMNILRREGQAIFYLSERIGLDLNEAVVWYKDPANQRLKTAILEKIQNIKA